MRKTLIFAALLAFLFGAAPADATCMVHVHKGATPYVFLLDNKPVADDRPENQHPKDFELSMVIRAFVGSPWIMRQDTVSWHPKDVTLTGKDCPKLR